MLGALLVLAIADSARSSTLPPLSLPQGARPSLSGLPGDCLAPRGDTASSPESAIAIVIDDLGNDLLDVDTILALPAPVALAVLPGTPFARTAARRGRDAGREVLLHQPMTARQPAPDPGPRALREEMAPEEFEKVLKANLSSVPGAQGLNGHMGSRLTADAAAMDRLMGLLRTHGDLFFVDSYTHAQSVALVRARAHGLPATRRDVFLDHDYRPQAIATQLARLCRLSRKRGAALAIGHPHASTLQLLGRALPQLREQGFRMVSVRELIALQQAAVDPAAR